MAIEIPYTLVPKRLKQFMERIPTDGIPDKITLKTLEERGFRSSNDRSIIRVLKAVGLTDDNGTPTQAWAQYRDRNINRAVLADLIRAAYRDLFQVFPDAQSRPEADLQNFMSAKTKAPASTVRLMVGTFQSLCSLADFNSDIIPGGEFEESISEQSPANLPSFTRNGRDSRTATLPQIQIILHLPETQNSEIYAAIFKNIAHYLLGQEIVG